MKKLLFVGLVLSVLAAVAELPILPTTYRKAPLKIVKEQAEAGKAEAQIELALRYYAGHQVEKNAGMAFQLMHLAADQQHPEALFLLSRMVAEGIGTKADPEKEERWLAKAIVVASDNEELFARYEQIVGDEARSERFLKKCADAGYQPAVLLMQLPQALTLYKKGQFEDALPLFLKLAENGSAESAYYAGRIYADGKSNLAVDAIEAFVWFKQAAEGGYARAQYEVAVRYKNGEGVGVDHDRSAVWFRKAAGQGHANAQYRLAEMEFDRAVAAESVADPDDDSDPKWIEYRRALRKAVGGYQAAAKQEHVESLFVLGRLYASGEGVVRDLKQAMACFEEAFSLGHAEAGFYLGLMHHAGLGAKKDVLLAIEYYQKAADHGVSGALYCLANCYRFGSGVAKHPPKGEGVYYGKILKPFLIQSNGVAAVDKWVLKAAREYGVLKWNQSGSVDELSDAITWVGLAAQNQDAVAVGVFQAMQQQLWRMKEFEATYERMTETSVNPAADLLARNRRMGFLPYVERTSTEVPYGAKIQRISDNLGEGASGVGREGLHIKYMRPATSRGLGFSGVVLVGLEFEHRKTGERYWTFAEHLDREPLIEDRSVCDLVVSVSESAVPDSKLTGWAVVYGQLQPDGRTISVFDARDDKTDGMAVLFARNRYSTAVEFSIDAGLDLIREIGDHTLEFIEVL